MILAATGHRPNKLGGYSPAVEYSVFQLAMQYLETLPYAKRPNMVISGMAQGWDMAWASAAYQLGIPFIAAVPFHGFENKWPAKAQHKYRGMLGRARKVEIISVNVPYDPILLHRRNVWMVDHCDEVVALWDGSAGGTKNCITYALLAGKPVINLWDKFTPLTESKPSNTILTNETNWS